MTTKRIKTPKVSTTPPEQLTAEDLFSIDTGLDATKTITITVLDHRDNTNKQFKVDINTHFRESRLKKIALKYITMLQDLTSRHEVEDETIGNTISLIPTLFLKEFTSLPLQDPKSIEDLVLIEEKLLDNGVLEQVFPHLPSDELENGMNKIQTMASNAGQLMGELAVQQALKDVDNLDDNEPEATGSSDQ